MGAAGALGNDTKFGNRAGHRLLQLRLGTSWRQTLGLGSGSAFFSPQLHPNEFGKSVNVSKNPMSALHNLKGLVL